MITQRDLFHTSLNKTQSNWTDQHSKFELLSRIATMYYLEELTQDEIAKRLCLSRPKVQRLLKQARNHGIVEIHVHGVPVYHLQLENKLRELFDLKDAVIAPFHPDGDRRRGAVAMAAADFLERHICNNCKIAVGLGRNTSEVAGAFNPPRAINCTFVSAMGGSPQSGNQLNPNQICNRFAAHQGGTAQLLYAPAYVKDEEVRNVLLAQEAVKTTIDLARQADIAVMGIGPASDNSILIQAGCQTVDEVRRLNHIGAVGEILGNYYDLDGRKVISESDGRLISLTLDELRQIPLVIAVVSEVEKAPAVLGALRSGAISTLVSDCQLAIAVLKLAGVNDLNEEHDLFESL